MKHHALWFAGLAGFLLGCVFGRFLAPNGIGTNSGSEFYGSEFAEAAKAAGKGFGSNSGSKFYGDAYIKAKLQKGD